MSAAEDLMEDMRRNRWERQHPDGNPPYEEWWRAEQARQTEERAQREEAKAQAGKDAPAIDGAELLARVRDWLATYISTVSDSDLDLLTLWAVHTHLVKETYYTPRL